MEILQKITVILIGFTVWMCIAPRFNNPRYGELFLAYMTALLLSLVASSELFMTTPIPLFFTIGGVFAFCFELLKKTVRITIRK
ncbi:MAG: hypothetical protein LBR56_02390 [Sporomusaceae bacterium]|jgi:hypothetical protein|nr:hypothetical protein [Sporomusaceae bacterium]